MGTFDGAVNCGENDDNQRRICGNGGKDANGGKGGDGVRGGRLGGVAVCSEAGGKEAVKTPDGAVNCGENDDNQRRSCGNGGNAANGGKGGSGVRSVTMGKSVECADKECEMAVKTPDGAVNCGEMDDIQQRSCGNGGNAANGGKGENGVRGVTMGKSVESADKECETAVKTPDGAVITGKKGDSVYTLVIAGQIEGHSELPVGQKATKYELLIPQLVSIEESEEVCGLLLILNTVGGDVEAGLALSELVAGMRKRTATLVLGGGHSIGVPLAVSADRSFIVPTATMTLHPVRTSGLVLSAPQSFNSIERMQDRIIEFVARHSKIGVDRFRELMLNTDEMATDMGSVLDGVMAVREGLIDRIGGLADALDYLHGKE